MPKLAAPIRIPEDERILAYVAGIVDGEGHIGINPSSPGAFKLTWSYSAQMTIVNTDARLMTWLVATFGSSVACHNPHRPGHWKLTYAWHLSGENLRRFLLAIRPYLLIKGEQADLALALFDLRKTKPLSKDIGVRKGAGRSAGRRPNDPEYVEAAQALYDRIRPLNARQKAEPA